MTDQLLKILDSITPSPEDENDWGLIIVKIIKSSKVLHDPKDDYAYLKQYLKDKMDFLDQEIAFTTKYKDDVYNPMVSKSREFEKEICEKILEGLNKI